MQSQDVGRRMIIVTRETITSRGTRNRPGIIVMIETSIEIVTARIAIVKEIETEETAVATRIPMNLVCRACFRLLWVQAWELLRYTGLVKSSKAKARSVNANLPLPRIEKTETAVDATARRTPLKISLINRKTENAVDVPASQSQFRTICLHRLQSLHLLLLISTSVDTLTTLTTGPQSPRSSLRLLTPRKNTDVVYSRPSKRHREPIPKPLLIPDHQPRFLASKHTLEETTVVTTAHQESPSLTTHHHPLSSATTFPMNPFQEEKACLTVTFPSRPRSSTTAQARAARTVSA